MANLMVQHSMQHMSGMSADRFINTFHVSTTGAVDAALLAFITAKVKDFYFAPAGGAAASIDTWLTAVVNGPGSTVKIYDMAGPPPHPPLSTDVYQKSVQTGGSSLPEEVACCVTLQASPVPGIPAARLRGRLYIGPFLATAGAGAAGAASRPVLGLRNSLINAVATLQASLKAHTPSCALQVYSPTIAKSGGAGAANAWHAVTSASCDDAWDIQRRRGVAPTGKVTIAIP